MVTRLLRLADDAAGRPTPPTRWRSRSARSGGAVRSPGSRLPWPGARPHRRRWADGQQMRADDRPARPEYDPETLREVYADPDAVRARMPQLRAEIRHAPDEIAELLARGELVVLLRGLGELDEALDEAQPPPTGPRSAATRPSSTRRGCGWPTSTSGAGSSPSRRAVHRTAARSASSAR